MRTTVDIDKDLDERLRKRAAELGISFKETRVNSGGLLGATQTATNDTDFLRFRELTIEKPFA